MQAELYPLERKLGHYKCDNREFLVYDNIEETDTFFLVQLQEHLLR